MPKTNPRTGSSGHVTEHPISHDHLVNEQLRDIIRRAHWQSAKSTEDVAPHQYCVIRWAKDDLTEDEFWLLANAIRQLGRREVWTPPEEWVNRWGGRPMANTYLYVGEGADRHAYWYTHPRQRVPMLNRELVSVQSVTPTRRVIVAREATT